MRIIAFAAVLALSLNTFARENRLLDAGWKFNPGEHTNAAAADFNDTSWQAVSVPHCWGWQDAQQGKSYYRGPGWYRRELDATPENGKRFFLRFEAASLVAEVYLNGKLLGEHRGGFGAFGFEITTQLNASGKNLLAVRVSNEKFPDVAPLGGDFSVYGGLYRPVHLIVTSEEHFALTDHGSPGVAWLQTSVSAKQAELDQGAARDLPADISLADFCDRFLATYCRCIRRIFSSDVRTEAPQATQTSQRLVSLAWY